MTISEALALAMQHHQAGRLAQAEEIYRLVLGANPTEANALAMLGVVAHQKGNPEEAISLLRQAIRIFPQAATFHSNLGGVYVAVGRWDLAVESYTEAVRCRPQSAQDRNCLGNALRQVGRLKDAEDSFREALRLWPEFAEARANLGAAKADQGKFAEAVFNYRKALQLRPDLVEAHHNLGVALTEQGNLDEALTCFEQALKLEPNSAEALSGLAGVYRDLGQLEQAISYYRQAVASKPNVQFIQSNLLCALHYTARYDPESVFAEKQRWGRQFENLRQPLPAGNRDPARRLRIGYVSPDFRENVMGRYSEAVVKAHDRRRVEVFCYANLGQTDRLTERIQAAADHWRSISGLSDSQVADLIGRDQIDLLIDLSGHTGGNRLGVFARKPAPIQVTHFSYCDTTGLTAIDYRLTDEHCDPPGRTERFHTEVLVRLPDVQWCYPRPAGPDLGPLPAASAGYVTFGAFNNLGKVTEEMIQLWAQILKRVPDSRLHVLTGVGKIGDERILAGFVGQGVGRERLTLLGRKPRDAYFQLFRDVDVCLDTYPFTGCNTTADAVWMGVPVVTLAGPTCTTRQGVAVLRLVGLGDLVTESPEAYVETAAGLARDLPRLLDLRAGLRQRLVSSALCDEEGMARKLEAAYREMWQRFCRSG